MYINRYVHHGPPHQHDSGPDGVPDADDLPDGETIGQEDNTTDHSTAGNDDHIDTVVDNMFKDKEKEKKNHSRQANPFYAWMVQPLAETGIKEGQFFLARSSQKFSFDRAKLTKSLRSFDSDSGVSYLSSMYKDGVDKDYGGGEEMGNTLEEILIN